MRSHCLLILALAAASVSGQTRDAKSLQIYVVDVEGGNATLFVAPSGESVLIDTGNPGPRDTDRILAAVKDAGLTRIDHLITTHWHGDHYGGMPEVASRVPIAHFIDHGPSVEDQPKISDFVNKTYPGLFSKATRSIATPGDTIPVKGLDWRIVMSAGKPITTALRGGGAPNPSCAAFKPQDEDNTDNAQSVGSVVSFGSFRVVHLGDLTWNKERDLMCPVNRIGTVDLFIASHHGLAVSNSEVLVHALQPRVAIINNGIRKGAQPPTMKTILSSPRLETLWTLHVSQLSAAEYPRPDELVANTQPEAHNDGPAYWIKVTAQQDGSFIVLNQRNGFAKTYKRG